MDTATEDCIVRKPNHALQRTALRAVAELLRLATGESI